MTTVQLIDDFLDPAEAKRIRETLESNKFPWNYCPKIVSTQLDDQYQFTHMFYMEGEPRSHWYQELLLGEFLTKLDACALIKIKANFQPKAEEIHENEMHTDHTFPNAMTAIYYVNSNNGYTYFDEETRIDSIENRLVVFPSNTLHGGTTCTDANYRSVININFFPCSGGTCDN